LPRDHLFRSIYDGAIYTIRQSPPGLALAEYVRGLLPTAADSALASAEESNAEFPAIKRKLLVSAPARVLIRALVIESGMGSEDILFDPPALRVIAGVPEGPCIRHVHRDTWYAASHSQINWWLAVEDVTPSMGIAFYPGRFNAEVRNDSEILSFQERITFITKDDLNNAPNPYSQESLDSESPMEISLRAGDVIVFSAAHLHGTIVGRRGTRRVSLDFRTVVRSHHDNGRGAPNVDCRCSGTSVDDLISWNLKAKQPTLLWSESRR